MICATLCLLSRSLLDNDGQVHSLVNFAIDMIGAGGGEWSDNDGSAANLNMVDNRRSRLAHLDGPAILPGAVGDEVDSRDIIDQDQLRAFGNGHGALEKGARAHMHRRHAIEVGGAARHGRLNKAAQQERPQGCADDAAEYRRQPARCLLAPPAKVLQH